MLAADGAASGSTRTNSIGSVEGYQKIDRKRESEETNRAKFVKALKKTRRAALVRVGMVEAGGVEPPSEKRNGQKTTCLSRSICFAGVARNAQEALPASPIYLAVRPRTEITRPARCVTPRSEPTGEAREDGLR
jgi:hypothetical protein